MPTIYSKIRKTKHDPFFTSTPTEVLMAAGYSGANELRRGIADANSKIWHWEPWIVTPGKQDMFIMSIGQAMAGAGAGGPDVKTPRHAVVNLPAHFNVPGWTGFIPIPGMKIGPTDLMDKAWLDFASKVYPTMKRMALDELERHPSGGAVGREVDAAMAQMWNSPLPMPYLPTGQLVADPETGAKSYTALAQTGEGSGLFHPPRDTSQAFNLYGRLGITANDEPKPSSVMDRVAVSAVSSLLTTGITAGIESLLAPETGGLSFLATVPIGMVVSALVGKATGVKTYSLISSLPLLTSGGALGAQVLTKGLEKSVLTAAGSSAASALAQTAETTVAKAGIQAVGAAATTATVGTISDVRQSRKVNKPDKPNKPNTVSKIASSIGL